MIVLYSQKQEFVFFTSWYSFTGDGKCVICDSYVRPCTLVRICDECNYGSYQGRCVICGGPGVSDAYYCKECTVQEKDVSDTFATNNLTLSYYLQKISNWKNLEDCLKSLANVWVQKLAIATPRWSLKIPGGWQALGFHRNNHFWYRYSEITEPKNHLPWTSSAWLIKIHLIKFFPDPILKKLSNLFD